MSTYVLPLPIVSHLSNVELGSRWKTHKLNCQPFDAAESTVTLKPFYDSQNAYIQPVAKLARDAFNIPSPDTPAAHHRW